MVMRSDKRARGRRGQATTESMVVAAMLTAMVGLLALLLYAMKEWGVRIIDLVSSEYP